MVTHPFELETPSGVVLQGRDWLPDAATPLRGVVQLVHGLGEHGMRYAPLAERLNAAGYGVTGHDNRGHGLTAGAERLGLLPAGSGWTQWIEDILRVAERAGNHWPGTPHILLGHSLGSLMCQHVAALHAERFAGIVLSATDNRPGPGTGINHVLANLLSRLTSPETRSSLLYWIGVGHLRASIPNRRTNADWLSRDPVQVDGYLSDPLCGFIPSTALWQAIADGMSHISGRLRGRLSSTDTPLMLMVGTGDPLSAGGRRVRSLLQAYRHNGATRITLKEYPGARHELFNELNREEVIGDLKNWLDGVVADIEAGTVAAAG
ncbi:MAG: alpha/beta fold hydrolase [Aquisalimonadaceae bacterium]